MFQPIVSKDIPRTSPIIKGPLNLGYKYVKDTNLQLKKEESFKSASEILALNQSHISISTSILELDQLLGGGVSPGEIVEFTGAPGTGKTQLCFQATIDLLYLEKESEVIYFSTNSNFSLIRVENLLRKKLLLFEPSLNTQQIASELKLILRRLKGIVINDLTDLLAAIRFLELTYLIDHKVSLIVIDSIFIPFKSLNFKQRNRLIYLVFNQLQNLGNGNFAIFVTNSLSTRFKNPEESYITPCLGSAYYHRINIRILLSKSECGSRSALVLKCPLISSRNFVNFSIN